MSAALVIPRADSPSLGHVVMEVNPLSFRLVMVVQRSME